MPTSAQIAARQAIFAQFKAAFNDGFRPPFNAAFLALKALNDPMYAGTLAALERMAADVNLAGTDVTTASRQTDALIPSDPPPAPVNCALSDWIEGTWSSCVNGSQSRTDTRTVVTPPANGGAACGELTRVVTQACVVTPPPAPPKPGALKYSHYIPTNVGAPAGTVCLFGKHTQFVYCSTDGKVRAYGGDGGWRLANVNFAFTQALNSVLAYDFAQGGKLEVETHQHGSVEDGTAPYYHDGCTWVHNTRDDLHYAMPGYQPSYQAKLDPNSIMKQGVFHTYDRKSRKWAEIVGPRAAQWPGEHWGGAYDAKRNRIWIQGQGQSPWGALKFYDCGNKTFGEVGLGELPGLARYPNIGWDIRTERWKQRINPVTDELICFDGYRGLVLAIPLAPPIPVPRIIAKVPALRGDTEEPLGAIEVALCLSVKRQRVYLSYPDAATFVIGGIGGVWSIDLKSGESERLEHPPGAPSWTEGEYDDTNDLLMLAGIYGTEKLDEWGKRFLIYKYGVVEPPVEEPPPPPPVLPTANKLKAEVISKNTLRSVMYGTAGPYGGGSNYLDIWCSAVLAEHADSIVIANGGDGDYWGNEVYRFSFASGLWSRESERSVLNGVTAPGGDPNFDGLWGEHAGAPGVPHSYDAMDYLPPELGGGERGALLFPTRSFVYAIRKFWHPHYFDIAAKRWKRGSTAPNSVLMSLQVDTPSWCFDSKRRRHWCVPAGSSPIRTDTLPYLDFVGGLATAGSVGIPTFLVPGGMITSRYWPSADALIVVGREDNAFALYKNSLADASGFARMVLQGATIPSSAGYGLAYCGDLDCFFVKCVDVAGTIWKIIPDGWRVEALAVEGAPEVGANGIWKRFMYDKPRKSLVWVPNTNAPVYAARVTAA